MSEHALTREEYTGEIEQFGKDLHRMAEELAAEGDFENTRYAILEMASDELDNHEWFEGRLTKNGILYGSIIEHAETNPHRYSDWESLIVSEKPKKTLQRLAFVVAEADGIEAALGHLTDD